MFNVLRFFIIIILFILSAKHCSADTRRLIKKIISEGKTYRYVQDLLSCSAKMVRNALKYEAKEETRGRKTVVSQYTKRMIKNSSIKNTFIFIGRHRDKRLSLSCPSISVESVRSVLRQNNLCAQSTTFEKNTRSKENTVRKSPT